MAEFEQQRTNAAPELPKLAEQLETRGGLEAAIHATRDQLALLQDTLPRLKEEDQKTVQGEVVAAFEQYAGNVDRLRGELDAIQRNVLQRLTAASGVSLEGTKNPDELEQARKVLALKSPPDPLRVASAIDRLAAASAAEVIRKEGGNPLIHGLRALDSAPQLG